MGFLEKIIGNLLDKGLGGVRRRALTSTEEEKVISDWQRITELVVLGHPSGLKQAIINADKLMDYALKILVVGETMGERLKAARDMFSPETYDHLWQAHKVRNALVHETNYDPPHYVAKEAIDQFAAAFKELGVRI